MAQATMHVHADLTEVEAALERCVALAERFGEAWGDAPIPTAIEHIDVQPGDTLVLRHDDPLGADEVLRIKRYAAETFPGVTTVILSGGLRVATILRSEVPDAPAA